MKYKAALMWPLGLLPAGMPGAQADDATLPPNAQPVKFEKFMPAWSGFYAGANFGVLEHRAKLNGFVPSGPGSNRCFPISTTIDCSEATDTSSGGLGGLQIGYNFQAGNIVYGIEADIGASNAKNSRSGLTPGSYDFQSETGIETFGTARLRLGYAFDNGLMLYGTGGLAFAKVRDAFMFTNNSGVGPSYTWSNTNWRAGFAVGGGLEYMLSRNWSVKGEALYYDLGEKDHVSSSLTGARNAGISDRMTGSVARIGLNYLFH